MRAAAKPYLPYAAVATLLALAAPALPQPVEPGKEGELALLLAPTTEPGKDRICFSRRYDAAHMERHPHQRVTEMAFRLNYHAHEPDETWPQGQRNYYFQLRAKLRGSERVLAGSGECAPTGEPAGIVCGIECDGGGVRIRRGKSPDQLLVDLGSTGRIRMSESCDAEENAVDLEPGRDDRLFLLTRTGASDCPDPEAW